MSRTSVHVLRDRCMGTAMCASIAPEAFNIDETGHAVYNGTAITAQDDLQDAAESCPVAAIVLGPEPAAEG
jgi:ferredoxin